jgi:16S rRNA G966 N2-methylase RsmD
LAVSGLVEASSIVVAETSAREQLAARFGRLHEFDRRVYGDTALTFFRLVN